MNWSNIRPKFSRTKKFIYNTKYATKVPWKKFSIIEVTFWINVMQDLLYNDYIVLKF